MKAIFGMLVTCVVLLSGCATAQRPDPLEPVNRKVFAFNDALDRAVVKPVAKGYVSAVPSPVREGVSNFFSNPKDLWSAFNLFLQGRPADGFIDLARFGANTTVGLLGVLDVASGWGLTRHTEDIGLTLGHWGVGSGAHIVWPLLGPSTLRDSVNIPLDAFVAPQTYAASSAAFYGLTVLSAVDERARLLGATALLDDAALDRYLFVRDAYLQRRRNRVLDGKPSRNGSVPAVNEPKGQDAPSTDSIPTTASPAEPSVRQPEDQR